MSEVTYLEAIRQAMWDEMERDDRVVLLGEDVGLYGGAFKVTAGFIDKFGAERVIDTPISEEGYTGVAIGAAFNGLRPIVEFQFIDFIANAFNMITNFAAKSRYRWGAGVPIVMGFLDYEQRRAIALPKASSTIAMIRKAQAEATGTG